MKLRASFVFMSLLIAIPYGVSAQWESPQKLSTDTSANLNENMGQCIAVSGDNIHVVWEDNNVDRGAIFYRHSVNAGATWGPVVRLTPASRAAVFPSIAVSGSTVHVAFRDTMGGGTSYYMRSLDGGTTWDPVLSLGNYYWWPSITCSGEKVFVALNSNEPGNSEVWFRRSMDNGTTWDSVIRISNASGRSEDPTIAAAGECVHMAWNDNRTGIMQTWYRRSSDNGATWGPETQLTNSTVFCYFPILHAMDSFVDLAYGDRQSGFFEIYFKQSTNFGASWQPSLQMTHAGGTEAYPNIAHNGKNIYLVWWLFNADAYIQHSGDNGVTWDSAITLVSADNKPSEPFIAVSGATIHTIWIDQRDGYHALYYMRNPTGNLSIGNAGVSQSNSNPASIEIAPNPAASNAIVRMDSPTPLEDVTLNFYDGAARLVATKNVGHLDRGVATMPISLEHIQGTAFVRIFSGGELIGTAHLAILR
jgi:hypothetical protein